MLETHVKWASISRDNDFMVGVHFYRCGGSRGDLMCA